MQLVDINGCRFNRPIIFQNVAGQADDIDVDSYEFVGIGKFNLRSSRKCCKRSRATIVIDAFAGKEDVFLVIGQVSAALYLGQAVGGQGC